MSTLDSIRPECLWPVNATLGEGALWHAAERVVYFVDIKQHKLHRYDPASGERRSWDTPGQTGFVLRHVDGGLICGVQGGLHRFDLASGTFTPFYPIETDRPGNRLNDGYVDATGALWFGSMDDAEEQPTGVLYRVGADGQLAAADPGYVITNGPVMNPQGTVLYHNDTMHKIVYAFDVDSATGALSNKREFVRIQGSGHPDGMAMDSEGYLWVALFGGARIERFAPDGTLVGHVPFPCSNITKLVFGGDDGKTVYATTARKNLSEAELAEQPLAGGLFTFRVDVAGVEPAVCSTKFGN